MTSPTDKHPNADVRMRGFAERVTVETALEWLDHQLERLVTVESELVALGKAAGRVLADDVRSQVNVPDFERAMMDGFAVKSADLSGASIENPVTLKVVGECFPGLAFEQEVKSGCAVRIMTGAPLPPGVDAVLPVEKTENTATEVRALTELAAGKNFGSIGEDIATGEVVLQSGRVLRPQDVGLLSSIGQAEVSVRRQPRVRIVATGDELLPAGSKPEGCRIVDSNGPMLEALVARDGGIAKHPGIVPDNREAILAALRDEAEVILCSGGSSVGQEDHVPTLLAEHGLLEIHGVAMRPAAPLGMGHIEGKLVVLLPGNPVACLWGYDLFAGRAIRRIAGLASDWPYRSVEGVLSHEINSPEGRLDYIRVHCSDGQIKPVKGGGASVLSSTTKADGFVVVPTESQGFDVGDAVEVFLYG